MSHTILVLGGTTEGRMAAGVLEESGSPFFYSTKTGEQDLQLSHGTHISGAMDSAAMARFCQEHGVKLIIDAAHPFASELHLTVAATAGQLGIPVVHYERIFPPREEDISWLADMDEMLLRLSSLPKGTTVLSTLGVKSIGRLKPLEQEAGLCLRYRILRRQSSLSLALSQGATPDQLCYYGEDDDRPADVILLKESGLSGGFAEKVEAARRQGMAIFALARPSMPGAFITVNGPYGLRRQVERLLPDFFPLKSGLTTGTCATAAAVAAMMQLIAEEQKEAGPLPSEAGPLPSEAGPLPSEVPVLLPNGETISVPVAYGDGYASVIKDAGDDPDVTDGLEIRAAAALLPGGKTTAALLPGGQTAGHTTAPGGFASRLSASGGFGPAISAPGGFGPAISAPGGFGPALSAPGGFAAGPEIVIEGGSGVGRFTLPGFDYPPGQPAINRSPRQMIEQNIRLLLKNPLPLCRLATKGTQELVAITISVPDGERIAQKTFNPRLGIEGGISIIGVSGIVMPFSEEAFVNSIRKCMQVAKAAFPCQAQAHVVINSGAKSERFVKALFPELPPQAFVEYGNYIGQTLQIAHELGIPRVTLGVMLGKAVKLAAGHLDTHSRRSVMDKDFIALLLNEAGIPCSTGKDTPAAIDLSTITLARELWQAIPREQTASFARVVIAHCYRHCGPLLPKGTLKILLIDDNGKIYGEDGSL